MNTEDFQKRVLQSLRNISYKLSFIDKNTSRCQLKCWEIGTMESSCMRWRRQTYNFLTKASKNMKMLLPLDVLGVSADSMWEQVFAVLDIQ